MRSQAQGQPHTERAINQIIKEIKIDLEIFRIELEIQ